MASGIVTSLLLVAVGARAEFLDSFVPAPAPNPACTLPDDCARQEPKAESGPISLIFIAQEHSNPTIHAIPGESRSHAGFWLTSHALLVWQFLTTVTFAGLVKVLCVTGNVLVQVSPIPQVRSWMIEGDTGGSDSAPYVSIAFGGWQWCFYGVFAWVVTGRSGFLILLQSNSLGAVLGTYYTFAFYRQCQSEQSRLSLQRYLSFVAGLVFFEACTTMVLPSQRALTLVGLVSAFCGFVSALSVLITVPTVLRTKDSKSIPGPVVTASFLTNCLWSICGAMLSDALILLPSLAGLCANLVCVTLKVLYLGQEEEKPQKCCKEADVFSNEFALKCGQEPSSEYRVTPTLRAQLRERMADRWRTALLLKPTEQTPLLKVGNQTNPFKIEACAEERADAERAPEVEAIHEDTGGTC